MNNKEVENANSYKVHPNTERILHFRRTCAEIVHSNKLSFDCLSIDMVHEFKRVMQDQAELDRKIAFCEDLQSTIQRINPTWNFRIVPTGSSVTGLATRNSDLDVAIHIPQVARIVEEMCSGRLVTAEEKLVMWRECDDRFAPLCFVVKKWADSTGVKNPKDGGFNSYALVLLVIHFLQCGTSPPILPNLIKIYKGMNFIAQSEHDFPERLDLEAPFPKPLPTFSPNDASIAHLFFEFLNYYSGFKFDENYISIKDACVYSRSLIFVGNCSVCELFCFRKSSILPEAVRNQKQKQVYIEDPFDSHNPGRTVRSIRTLKKIFKMTIKKFNPNACSQDDNSSTNSDSNFKFPTLSDILNMSLSNQEEEDEEAQKEDENEEEEEEVQNVSVNGCNEFVEWR
ncbi:CBN-MUT-2 protein [Caenorhabditis brenneri]|uniref:CBN-MUT-2 protein n=1 Tax=Caenorhabditis brenneri TaxID=135651 RepID=G0NU13_CAEBE|nr:CBN-MUT-2 protein [Caenorhabditis brenneri]